VPTSSPSNSGDLSIHINVTSLCDLVDATNMAQLVDAGMVDGWTCSDGFPITSGVHICDAGWSGIGCNDQRRLASLTLANLGISGTIPASISQLVSLETLDLSGNNINGPLPDDLSTLTHLSDVRLANNQLGVAASEPSSNRRLQDTSRLPIPASLSQLQSLSYLDISSNLFEGSVDSSFCTSTPELTTLILNPLVATENDNNITCVAQCLLTKPTLIIIAPSVTACPAVSPPPTSAPTLGDDVKQQSAGGSNLSQASIQIVVIVVVLVLFVLAVIVYFLCMRARRREKEFKWDSALNLGGSSRNVTALPVKSLGERSRSSRSASYDESKASVALNIGETKWDSVISQDVTTQRVFSYDDYDVHSSNYSSASDEDSEDERSLEMQYDGSTMISLTTQSMSSRPSEPQQDIAIITNEITHL